MSQPLKAWLTIKKKIRRFYCTFWAIWFLTIGRGTEVKRAPWLWLLIHAPGLWCTVALLFPETAFLFCPLSFSIISSLTNTWSFDTNSAPWRRWAFIVQGKCSDLPVKRNNIFIFAYSERPSPWNTEPPAFAGSSSSPPAVAVCCHYIVKRDTIVLKREVQWDHGEAWGRWQDAVMQDLKPSLDKA